MIRIQNVQENNSFGHRSVGDADVVGPECRQTTVSTLIGT